MRQRERKFVHVKHNYFWCLFENEENKRGWGNDNTFFSLPCPNINIKEKKDKVGLLIMASSVFNLTFLIIISRGTSKKRERERETLEKKKTFLKKTKERERQTSDILRTLLVGSSNGLSLTFGSEFFSTS